LDIIEIYQTLNTRTADAPSIRAVIRKRKLKKKSRASFANTGVARVFRRRARVAVHFFGAIPIGFALAEIQASQRLHVRIVPTRPDVRRIFDWSRAGRAFNGSLVLRANRGGEKTDKHRAKDECSWAHQVKHNSSQMELGN
jgi:hypothetical protein